LPGKYNVAMGRTDRSARRYFVHGRVQGVGFRYFVQQRAAELRIDGYTRNLDDGRVEVFAQGTMQQLQELSGFLWKGPRLADVRGVEELEAAPEGGRGFRIER
jgi:acylphosphatase